MEINRILIQSWGFAKTEEYTEEKEKYYQKQGYLLDYVEDPNLWNILYVNKDLGNYTKIQARRLLEKYKQLRIELWIKIIFWAIIFLSILNIYFLNKTSSNLNNIVKVTKELKKLETKKSNNLDKFNFSTWSKLKNETGQSNK